MSENEIFTPKLKEQLDRMLEWDINTGLNVLYDVLATWVYETNKDLDLNKREALLKKIIRDTDYVIDQNCYARVPDRKDWYGNDTKDETLKVNAPIPAISGSKWQQFCMKLTFKIFRQPDIVSWRRQQTINANVNSWKKQQILKAELLTILRQMPVHVATKFLPELIGAWCLSYPREKAREYFDNSEISAMSDIAFANKLFAWLLRPFDYFK